MVGNDLLFVYGTLLRNSNRENHEFLASVEFMETARTNASLYDLGDYPGIILGGGVTLGEVYSIPSSCRLELFRLLDDYEGCGPDDSIPHLYRREMIPIVTASGKKSSAWAYVLNFLPENAVPIPSGDYRGIPLLN